jgi:hypothetical protein
MAVNEVCGATFKSESKIAADGALALLYASVRIETSLDRLMLVVAHCKESQADPHAGDSRRSTRTCSVSST